MTSNKNLQDIYERVYSQGKEKFFTFDTLDITKKIADELNYKDLEILEIGCGTGETAYEISLRDPKLVTAVDYSESAIKTAQGNYIKSNLKFEVKSIEHVVGKYDCIIMQEVIEHTDNPYSTIQKLTEHLKDKGHLILTCPSFLNIRGYVWMTLQLLFNVPMSLTDKHFISPFDMEKWAQECNLSLKWFTFRHDQGSGDKMIYDLKKRLTNALSDANFNNTNVDLLLEWLLKASQYEVETVSNGAKALYHFQKTNNNSPCY
ncbi:MAG: class I SAM-dependent methyltransferase [Firmicutes bacterium]|nr:class I SAM-dependent methyltransferase [Bacillota bacterium]